MVKLFARPSIHGFLDVYDKIISKFTRIVDLDVDIGADAVDYKYVNSLSLF